MQGAVGLSAGLGNTRARKGTAGLHRAEARRGGPRQDFEIVDNDRQRLAKLELIFVPSRAWLGCLQLQLMFRLDAPRLV